VPASGLCYPGIAETTLDDVHRFMRVLNVLDVREGFEMPEGGEYVSLRQFAIDAIDYAHKLVDMEDEMRGSSGGGRFPTSRRRPTVRARRP
jgi:hypothetical protein